MSRGRWRLAAGLGFFALAAMLAVSALRAGDSPELSEAARRFTGAARQAFVGQVRATDEQHELEDVKDAELVNRGAAYCLRLADTGSSLKAVFALQLAGQTHPGDVHVTAAARRHLCPDLPDTESPTGAG